MRDNSWAERLNGRQRAVHGFATVIALLIASAMFVGLRAPASAVAGAEHDCGPAMYALLAAPSDDPADTACRTAAGQRLTTVTGLIALTVIGSVIGGRLAATPRPRSLRPEPRSHVVTGTRPGQSVDARVGNHAGRTAPLPGHPHAD